MIVGCNVILSEDLTTKIARKISQPYDPLVGIEARTILYIHYGSSAPYLAPHRTTGLHPGLRLINAEGFPSFRPAVLIVSNLVPELP